MLMTGLSGNEIYCLAQKGFDPGNIVVGNSVHSLGLVRGFTSGLKMMSGGEIGSITELIVDGRHAAINRLEKEARDEGDSGLTGVVSDLRKLGGPDGVPRHRLVGEDDLAGRARSSRRPARARTCTARSTRLRAAALRHRQRGLCPGDRARDLRRAQGPRAAGRGQGILRHVQPHPAPGTRAARGRGRRARVQRRGGHHHADHPLRAGRPRDADGRHGVVQPRARAAEGALYLGADRRGAVEPDAAGLRPAPAAAGHERVRPGLRRRVHGVLPLVRPRRGRTR